MSAKTNDTSPPFLGKDDYTDRLGTVVQNVLADHRFTLPPTVVQGSDGSIWFVTERLETQDRFDRIYVYVTADSEVEANIRPYDYILDDWALLGKSFVDFGTEERSIAADVAKKVRAVP